MGSKRTKEQVDEYRYRLKYVIGIILVIIILFVSLSYVKLGYNFKQLLTAVPDKEAIIQTLIAGCISFLAAALYSLFESNKMMLYDNRLRKLCNFELLEKIKHDLKNYDNRYCEDYNIKAVIENGTEDSYYIVRIDYDYKKIIKNRNLHFQIDKLRQGNKDSTNFHIPKDYYGTEFYYVLDETELCTTVDVSRLDSEYMISDLQIHNTQIPLKQVCNNNEIFKSEAIIPDEIDVDNLVKIRYSVSFPIEKESFLYLTIELPSKSVSCSFDYSKIKNDIDISGQAYLMGPAVPYHKDYGEVKYSLEDWVMPKSGFMFVWWRK